MFRSLGLMLGLAFVVAMASGAVALLAGIPAQALQEVMVWTSFSWFAAWCLLSRWWSSPHRLKTQGQLGLRRYCLDPPRLH